MDQPNSPKAGHEELPDWHEGLFATAPAPTHPTSEVSLDRHSSSESDVDDASVSSEDVDDPVPRNPPLEFQLSKMIQPPRKSALRAKENFQLPRSQGSNRKGKWQRLLRMWKIWTLTWRQSLRACSAMKILLSPLPPENLRMVARKPLEMKKKAEEEAEPDGDEQAALPGTATIVCDFADGKGVVELFVADAELFLKSDKGCKSRKTVKRDILYAFEGGKVERAKQGQEPNFVWDVKKTMKLVYKGKVVSLSDLIKSEKLDSIYGYNFSPKSKKISGPITDEDGAALWLVNYWAACVLLSQRFLLPCSAAWRSKHITQNVCCR